MTFDSKVGAVGAVMLVVAAILFVVFSEMTVRKLEKNPETKKYLGISFVPRGVVGKVAMAFALPRTFNRKLRNGRPGGLLQPDVDVLEQHTSLFDRILARIFFWVLMSGTCITLFAVLLSKMMKAG